MKKLLIALASTASILVAGQAGGQDGQSITIATEGAFPPWNAVDTSGKPVGFDIDVGKALCQRAALKCEFVTQAWDGIIPALSVGKYDAIMAGMSITEKRKEVIAFSRPYALTSNYFVVARSFAGDTVEHAKKIDLSANTAEDMAMLDVLKSNLEGKIIGVQGSTNAEAFVRKFFGDKVEIRTYETQDNLNLDLVAGRIDAGLADYSVWKAFLDSSEGAQATLYGPRISGGLFGPGVGVGFRKQDQELVKRFNEAIGAIASDGTLKEISAKWFGADLAPE
jgi:octopine/nopaline transport system substrate-binding protein